MPKYYNKKTNGYDSKKESIRASNLKILERAGSISDLKEQVIFELQPSFKLNGKTERSIKYIADFTYIQDDNYIVEDVKGFKTEVYKLKRKMLLFKYSNIKFIES